jgi:Ser/Thr protein kinase RdoA (MazF antagonist)
LNPADVEALLARWPAAAGGVATLVNLSENHTFRIEAAAGRSMLRLHRPGYQSGASIASELAWLAAIRADTGLPVPRALPGWDGEALQEVAAGRFAVLFAHEPGREPQPADDLVPLFETIGAYAAQLHRHARTWTPPAGFTRQRWSADNVLGRPGLWGDWRAAPGVAGRVRAVLDRLERRLRADLAAYGAGPDRFGLVHADMRLANLLVTPGRTTLIDFDDCGLCWFVYDLAASLSFIEADPRVPALKAAWFEGYARHGALAAMDVRAADAMILLRRMALLAWIGTHAETALAAAHATDFAAGTARLAQDYLATPGL